MKLLRWMLLAAGIAAAQSVPPPAPAQNQPPQPPALTQDQNELRQALSEIGNSNIDLIRILEAHLKKYPDAKDRKDIEKALAKAAIETKDDQRTALYGQKVLVDTPDDMLMLDRVAKALLVLGGKDNARKSLDYSRLFESIVLKMEPPAGPGAAKRQEDRDRAVARSLLYQSRARTTLGELEEAEKLAAKSYTVYPSEESARDWAAALEALHRGHEATIHFADALMIPDVRALDSDRAQDRKRLGELYRNEYGSEKGLGDVVLQAYDRTAAIVTARDQKYVALDPNSITNDPLNFTLTGLDGQTLLLSSMKGRVVVLDFWATWCHPCRAQHPMYEEVKKRFQNRNDVVFLSIDSEDDHTGVGKFLDEQKWSRQVYFDSGLAHLLQITEIPTTVLFDKKGRVASRMNGFLPDRFVDQLTERINSALSDSGQ